MYKPQFVSHAGMTVALLFCNIFKNFLRYEAPGLQIIALNELIKKQVCMRNI